MNDGEMVANATESLHDRIKTLEAELALVAGNFEQARKLCEERLVARRNAEARANEAEQELEAAKAFHKVAVQQRDTAWADAEVAQAARTDLATELEACRVHESAMMETLLKERTNWAGERTKLLQACQEYREKLDVAEKQLADHAEDWAVCGLPHDGQLAKNLVLSDANHKLRDENATLRAMLPKRPEKGMLVVDIFYSHGDWSEPYKFGHGYSLRIGLMEIRSDILREFWSTSAQDFHERLSAAFMLVGDAEQRRREIKWQAEAGVSFDREEITPSQTKLQRELDEARAENAALRAALGGLVDAVNTEFPGGINIGGRTGVALIRAVNVLADKLDVRAIEEAQKHNHEKPLQLNHAL